MKTFNKLKEDLEQRRQELAQRQREKVNDFMTRTKEKAQAQAQAQQAQRDAADEREALKREIKNELKRERGL